MEKATLVEKIARLGEMVEAVYKKALEDSRAVVDEAAQTKTVIAESAKMSALYRKANDDFDLYIKISQVVNLVKSLQYDWKSAEDVFDDFRNLG